MVCVVVMLLAAWVYRRLYRRHICKKHGHVWVKGKKRLKCHRCKRKAHGLTIIKPS